MTTTLLTCESLIDSVLADWFWVSVCAELKLVAVTAPCAPQGCSYRFSLLKNIIGQINPDLSHQLTELDVDLLREG